MLLSHMHNGLLKLNLHLNTIWDEAIDEFASSDLNSNNTSWRKLLLHHNPGTQTERSWKNSFLGTIGDRWQWGASNQLLWSIAPGLPDDLIRVLRAPGTCTNICNCNKKWTGYSCKSKLVAHAAKFSWQCWSSLVSEEGYEHKDPALGVLEWYDRDDTGDDEGSGWTQKVVVVMMHSLHLNRFNWDIWKTTKQLTLILHVQN